MIRLVENHENATQIAATIHGKGLGFDVEEVFKTMLFAIASELRLRQEPRALQEIIIVERDKLVFRRLQQRHGKSMTASIPTPPANAAAS
jgi:hypothetical protein